MLPTWVGVTTYLLDRSYHRPLFITEQGDLFDCYSRAMTEDLCDLSAGHSDFGQVQGLHLAEQATVEQISDADSVPQAQSFHIENAIIILIDCQFQLSCIDLFTD